MRLYARIALLLGGFLLAAGLVYGLTGYEWRGFVLLLIAGSGFAYVGLYARRTVRAADRTAGGAAEVEPAAQAEAGHGGAEPRGPETDATAGHLPHMEEVRPTIWPLVFSLAGAGIVAGVLASHWLLIVGGVLAVAAAAGWFFEALAQRQEHN
ncbi:MAG TPA: cytochrome c oxidase subunit 4 [Actinomycetes bacterium]